jgi:adenine-specific DNA-methyltransferase
MELKLLKPRLALNKAFLKVKPNRPEIELFKKNLVRMIDTINESESEEFHKNEVSKFLQNTYYGANHYINTKDRKDLVIHNGNTASSTVGVIIEAKKPVNKAEMLKPGNINTKAFQELLLYYLRERITHKNLDIKHLIATNIYEWYIFDAQLFEKVFAQNKSLIKNFVDFEEGRMSGNTTDFFYSEIAAPAISAIGQDITFAYFDIRDYEKPLRNDNPKDDTLLIALYKLLSPQHLLKLPFANDSNSLDKAFYTELLHMIGLTEIKEGSKKLIQRKKEGERNAGSLLESAILQLDNLDKISRLNKPSLFGNTYDERLFNVALELSITWVNRILFLKLLEAQLIKYHKGNKSFAFLNTDKVKNFDGLNTLFFQVLAKKTDERSEAVMKLFANVPYLNSSLFEPTEIEHSCLFISQLADSNIPILSNTVIKDNTGKKRTGEMSVVEYIFEFLNAYDFSSEGSEEIQEDNKRLINASVLGLIFEKINGYKDGSFFTPGFITMYMCRETIRRAVLQKFNDTKGWKCTEFGELYDKIDAGTEARLEANTIINSLRICDPAVGSGHFLVSALNEMIAIKSELRILQDREGKRLKEYAVQVENDELVVTDDDGLLFEYNPNSKESQRIQETLFHEKQTIIENCLFGVDINPNSVKICRLRLWIELLKNAYYRTTDVLETRHALSLQGNRELETLPNIDINIKCGNSLISRYALDADIKKALKRSKWTIDSYRLAVMQYRNARSKDEKREMERLIASIKADFESEVALNDKRVMQLNILRGELYNLSNQTSLFDMSKAEKAKFNKAVAEKAAKITKLETELDEIRNNKIYENAFEWRFEFPEVLNDEGGFVGFDVVIGNPPYIRQEEFSELKDYLINTFVETGTGTADLFVYFVEQAMKVLRTNGEFSFIIPNKWMRAGYGKKLRQFVSNHKINHLIDFGDLPVFEEATTYPNIIQLKKTLRTKEFNACNVATLNFNSGLEEYIKENDLKVNINELSPEGWTLSDTTTQALLTKIRNKGVPLGEYVNGKIYRGVVTGLNDAFVIDEETKERLITEDPNCAEVLKPFLAGRDIKRYEQPLSNKYLILAVRGIKIEKYPAIYSHLTKYRTKLEKKAGSGKWYELQASPGDISKFEEIKIMYPDISKNLNFIIDNNGNYCVNTVYNIGSDSKGLLGYLNSKLFLFNFQTVSNSIRGGYLRFFTDYMKECPVPVGIERIEPLVNQIYNLNNQSLKADTSPLESQIDQLVYELYDLTEEEIRIIEGK